MTTQSSTRRGFLGWLGLSGAAVAMPWGNRLPRASHLQGFDPAWDLAWVDRIKGDRRAVFDSPGDAGDGVFRATAWRDQYASVFGIDRAQLTPVLVIRHHGIVFAMDDSYWKSFADDSATESADGSLANGKPSSPDRNPARRSIERLLKDGGIVLACNMAFEGQVVSKYRGDGGGRSAAVAHLIAGVILQPSGPFALMRAQDANCHYMLAS